MRTREDAPADDEADKTGRPTEAQEVTLDGEPTTCGVRVIITGDKFPAMQLYIRFGETITRGVCGGLGPELTRSWL